MIQVIESYINKAMSKKQIQYSYSALVREALRISPDPQPIDMILGYVNSIRPIKAQSAKQTIRNAITGCKLIANAGGGRYGLYPRLITGSYVRVPIIRKNINQQQILFGREVIEMLWPASHDSVDLYLPNDLHTSISLVSIDEGDWGTIGSIELWKWLGSYRIENGDWLLIEAINVETRKYKIQFQKGSDNIVEIKCRTDEIEMAARTYLRRNWHRGVVELDFIRHLFATGYYKNQVPPLPFSYIWTLISPNSGESRIYRKMNASYQWARDKTIATVYQLRIMLQDSNPPIWRRILVSDDTTLDELHRIIQVSMGWTDSHLHQFFIYGQYYSDQHSEYCGFAHNETDIYISDVIDEKSSFRYQYDFGDSWNHAIEVEAIRLQRNEESLPCCIAGARACPPEDCGGVWGYEHLLEVLRNKKHPEYREMRSWIGRDLKPERIDFKKINQNLKKLGLS